jgi:hypothetical protein
MTETMTPPKTKTPERVPVERAPIQIERLQFTTANPHGLSVPYGPDGKSEKIVPNLTAGESGDVRTEIEHRPWMRVFRVTRLKKVTRTDEKTKQEVVSWVPMGKPFHIPDIVAVSTPVDD